MKNGVAAASREALPSAFKVFRDDLCNCVHRAAELAFDGVELALLHAKEVDVPRMRERLSATGLEIPCISSGRVFAADHLYFTHPDQTIRAAAVDRIIAMMQLAAAFGARVNTGRVRGLIHEGETAEILPKPEPDRAAAQAASYPQRKPGRRSAVETMPDGLEEAGSAQ